MQLKMTFYGFPDNDPSGRDIAYPHSAFPQTVHEEAGGQGTFEDPITTAATEGGQFAPGTRLYVPDLKKYLIIEDTCESCAPDQIDVWMESTENCSPSSVLDCEEKWTPAGPLEVEVNPNPGREADVSPFFNPQTCECAR